MAKMVGFRVLGPVPEDPGLETLTRAGGWRGGLRPQVPTSWSPPPPFMGSANAELQDVAPWPQALTFKPDVGAGVAGAGGAGRWQEAGVALPGGAACCCAGARLRGAALQGLRLWCASLPSWCGDSMHAACLSRRRLGSPGAESAPGCAWTSSVGGSRPLHGAFAARGTQHASASSWQLLPRLR